MIKIIKAKLEEQETDISKNITEDLEDIERKYSKRISTAKSDSDNTSVLSHDN